MKIDYNNLKKHFDILVKDTESKPLEYSLVDKNREIANKTKETDNAATIVNILRDSETGVHDHFCEWWRNTSNRIIVKEWFKEKYNN